jgi:hypothetical protein
MTGLGLVLRAPAGHQVVGRERDRGIKVRIAARKMMAGRIGAPVAAGGEQDMAWREFADVGGGETAFAEDLDAVELRKLVLPVVADPRPFAKPGSLLSRVTRPPRSRRASANVTGWPRCAR